MTTNIVPFPLSRRRAFVLRQANSNNGMSPEYAGLHLAHQLKVQHNVRGTAEDRINSSLKRAILAASEWQSSVAHEQ